MEPISAADQVWKLRSKNKPELASSVSMQFPPTTCILSQDLEYSCVVYTIPSLVNPSLLESSQHKKASCVGGIALIVTTVLNQISHMEPHVAGRRHISTIVPIPINVGRLHS